MNLADLRFDHPKTFWTSTAILTTGVLLTAFFLIPQTRFFEAAGVSAVQRRAIALKNAAYWYSRARLHAGGDGLIFETKFGNVVKYQDGLHSSIPAGEVFQDVQFHLADVVVVSAAETDRIVQAVRFKDARFDIYDGDKAVVWIGNRPLNIALIEAGAAKPDPYPPTNIVDQAFASYYWSQFKGESP